MELLKKFYEEEEGITTVEVIMLIAALVCVALLFKKELTKYVQNLMNKVFTYDGL